MIKVYIERHSSESIELYFPSLQQFYMCKYELDIKSAIEDFIDGAEYEIIEGLPSN